MKRITLATLLFATLLFATPALAQQQQPQSAAQRALEIMLNREIAAHQQDLGAAVQLQDQVATLTKEVDADKKQIADQGANVAELTKELTKAKKSAAEVTAPAKSEPAPAK